MQPFCEYTIAALRMFARGSDLRTLTAVSFWRYSVIILAVYHVETQVKHIHDARSMHCQQMSVNHMVSSTLA